jgi:nitronate monooxygenase
MEWNHALTGILKVAYPIIQAPMLGVTTPEMAASISNSGGLGSLPVGGLSPEKTLALIRRTKALTHKPFAVNLFAHTIPPIDRQKASAMQDFLEKLCTDNRLKYEKQAIESLRFYSYKKQIDTLLNENIPVVSFTFGVLDDASIKAFKEKGVVLIGTATCVKEALILKQKGIEIICAQGIEAGGHRGTFLEEEPLPQVSAMALVQQIISHVDKPVIWAGGINDGKTIRAALAMGAAGVQPGTVFLRCPESAAIPAYKEALKNASDTDSILTRAFSGRWARGLKNKMSEAIENSGLQVPPYPIQNSLTALLRAEAQKNNNPDFTNLWAGQSAFKAAAKPCAEIFMEMVRQAEEIGLSFT